MKNFYTIEGTEGSGKTTILNEVSKLLSKNNVNHSITREPGGTNVRTSEEIRELILKDSMSEIDRFTEFLLYLSSRNEHINKFIKPNLDSGKIVISDRYNDSSLAYQGIAKGISLDKMIKISDVVIGEYYPEKTFFIKIEPKKGIDRIMNDKDREKNRFDYMDINFHNEVYKGYIKLSELFPKRFVIIDGNNSVEKISQEIYEVISNGTKK